MKSRGSCPCQSFELSLSNMIQRYAYFLLFLVLLVYVMTSAQQILAPLVWAAFFAILLMPVSAWLEAKGLKRALSAIISIFGFTMMIAGVVLFLSSEVISLLSDLPKLGASMEENFRSLSSFLTSSLGISAEFQSEKMALSLEKILENLLGNLGQTLTSTAITITYLTLMPLFIFLLLYYRDIYFDFLVQINRQQPRKKTQQVVSVVRDVLQNYVVGMGIVTIIMMVLFTIALTLLDVNYPLFFAAFLAIFNLIPYVGVFLSSVVTVLYVYLTKDSLLMPFVTLATLWGLQIFENNFITPFVLGSKVQANPLAVIIALLAGGMIWGVSGMILFVPLVGALRAVFNEFEETKPWALLLGEKPHPKEPDKPS
jgi:predicted PurR-regulated permease PerM